MIRTPEYKLELIENLLYAELKKDSEYKDFREFLEDGSRKTIIKGRQELAQEILNDIINV